MLWHYARSIPHHEPPVEKMKSSFQQIELQTDEGIGIYDVTGQIIGD